MLTALAAITGLAKPAALLAQTLSDLYLARKKAQSDEEIRRIDGQIEETRARQSVLVAEAMLRINAYFRAALALGPLTYVLKIFLWDKVIGSFAGYSTTGSMFATDPLTVEQSAILAAIVAFYFVYDMKARK